MLKLPLLLLVTALSYGCSRPEVVGTNPAETAISETTVATVPTIHSGKPDAAMITAASTKGVKTLVSNLTAEEIEKNKQAGFDEKALSEQAGLKFVHIPIKATGYEVADVAAFAKVMDETGGEFVAHCASGNRSAGLYAAWLARYQKVPVEEAIERGKALGLSKETTIASVRTVAAKP